jgi:hypothetical protein
MAKVFSRWRSKDFLSAIGHSCGNPNRSLMDWADIAGWFLRWANRRALGLILRAEETHDPSLRKIRTSFLGQFARQPF